MLDIWRECRERYAAEGPFLFGPFTIADAFFAPVTRRFGSYGTVLPEVAQRYVDTMTSLSSMQEWLAAALAEHDFVEEDEAYRRKPTQSFAQR